MNFNLKPLVTEKAIVMIERDNILSFETEKNAKKDEIKKEVETIFKVKVEKVRTRIHDNRKLMYVRLKKEFPAIDVATKLGII